MFLLETNPLIAAVRNQDELEKAIKSPCCVVFILSTDILKLEQSIFLVHKNNKSVFIHIDLAEGIGKDNAGIGFVSKCGADGIISTRSNIIKTAKDWNLKTVQRFFIVDSHSIETALDTIKTSGADMIEIMPGIMPSVIKNLTEKIKLPVIAGGLIQTKPQIVEALEAGAYAISTSKAELWYV